MSGRLVILRHKSWNVWNQDNREKVLKDERLYREKNIENNEIKRLHDFNKSIDDIKSNKSSVISNDTTSNITERFTLFPDMEIQLEKLKQKNKDSTNEFNKEKLDRELAEQRKQGVAPVPFSESAIQPWYIAKDEKGNKVNDIKLIQKENREKKRKFKADPMSKLLKYSNEDIKQTNNVVNDKISQSTESKKDFINNLRLKRIERETIERKRAKLLVNNPDVIERYNYNNSHR